MNCKKIFAVSAAVSRLVSASEPVVHYTGDELIDTAMIDFEEGNLEKYGEFAPPEAYLRMLKPKYKKSKSKSKSGKSKKKKKWKPAKFKIKFGSDSSGSSDSYWSCDSSDSSCSSDNGRYVHHYKTEYRHGGGGGAAGMFILCCVCCYIAGLLGVAALFAKKGYS